jgi:DNA polymerase-4
VQVTIKDTQIKSIQRQKPTSVPTYLSADIIKTALEIIEATWKIGKPIRMLTVTAQNLTLANQSSAEQLSLFDTEESVDSSGKTEKIEKTIDVIREKYGRYSVLRGNILKNDLGINNSDDE